MATPPLSTPTVISSPMQRIEPFFKQCDFSIWLKKFELICKMAKIDPTSQVDFLMTNLDLSIFEAVVSAFPGTLVYNDVVSFLENRYSSQDKFLNRLEFFTTSHTGTYDEYASRLQTLYSNFDNSNMKEEILVAKFLSTLPKSTSTELRIRRPKTLNECVQICNSLNSSNTQLVAAAVSQNKRKPVHNSNDRPSNSHNKKCFRCGSSSHVASDTKCPARNATCNYCKKDGHFASVCNAKNSSDRSSKPNFQKSFSINMNNLQNTGNFSSVNSIHSSVVSKPFLTIEVASDHSKVPVTFLLDTGSDVSILPYSYYIRYFSRGLKPFSNASLKNFDQSEIHVLGVLQGVSCNFKDRFAEIDFIVCDADTCILGVDSISKLEITISGIHQPNNLHTFSVGRTVTTSSHANSAHSATAPQSLPKLNGYNFFIKLKPDAPTSLIQKQRRIPFALQDAVEKEIQQLLANDIIEEIDSSDFVSPIVVVPKSDSEIRLCVDYKRLNQHIIIDQHPLPTVDEIFSKLAGARYFSKLDLRSAYHQLEIREDSRDYTAFISHIGLFRYKRLPFGLASAPSAYMKVISNILRRCKNTVCYLDDILIFGDTEQIHDECLKATLDCLSAHGMTLNEKKCVYKKESLQFLGRMIGSDGVSPLPDTLEAIINASVPHDKHSLRSFLGLANFYRSFIPNAALLSSSLYDLLKDNVQFRWSEKHQKDFDSLKSALSNFVPLAFFNSDLDTPTFVTTDASSYGISAVLSQQDSNTGEERPVYFLSRKLSDMEQKYSVSEKEFLAVLWGVERLHQFLYGRYFTVRTDHQCLKQLLSNGIEGGSAPCRVIRWATKLLQYHFRVQYIPGKQNPVADALSRVPYLSKDSGVELFAVSLTQDLNSHPLTLDELTRETEADPLLQEVQKFIHSGWPSRISSVPNEIRGFWNVRNDLSIVNGVICRHDKFVIPSNLQSRLVAFAHEGHMGMSKCKSRLREFYWWPNLNSSVEEQVRTCPCSHENSRESPVQVPSYVNKPWHQLAIDIKGPIHDSSHRTHYILVLIDCYTKFTISRVVSTISSQQMIAFLNSVFSIFGHCVILTSDNGPQFISSEFNSFLHKKGIVHRRSSVYNPQSNGVVERFNRNLAKLLEVSKFKNGHQLQEEIDTYVLNYNSTFHATTGSTPSDLMFRYKSRNMLAMVTRPNNDDTVTEVGQRIAQRSQIAADYANKRRRPLKDPRFKVGDTVLSKRGHKGKLIEQVGSHTFRLDSGFCINTRNIRHRVPDIDPDSDSPSFVHVSPTNPSPSFVHSSPINTPTNHPQTIPAPSTDTPPRSPTHSSRPSTHSPPRSSAQDLPRSRPERTRRKPNHFQGYLMF